MSPGTSRRPAVIAAFVAGCLTVAKLSVGVLTGSLAVLATAVDSLMDLTCSGLNVFFLGLARKPPDDEHRFGHGKAEALSGVIQATIIAMGGLFLAGHSVRELLTLTTVRSTTPGIIVSAISVPISLTLGLYLRRQSRRLASVALRADAFHYLTDVGTSTVAAGALVAVRLTGIDAWDPIGSLAISGYIVFEAVRILKEAADELLDRGLPAAFEAEVTEVIASLGDDVQGYSDLRTRRSGKTVFIELRLRLDGEISFSRSHLLTEELIGRLRRRFGSSTQVMIDTDPVERDAGKGGLPAPHERA